MGAVEQGDLKRIIGFTAVTLSENMRINCIRHTPKLNALINKVRTKIPENTRARALLFAPALPWVWAETVKTALKPLHFANSLLSNKLFDCKVIAIKTTIMEHTQLFTDLLGQRHQAFTFFAV